jgi:periplasmic divalent cation tolerance protein
MPTTVIVLTTVADDALAEDLARVLVEERLAACVNLHPPMTSIYRWKGAVERAAERQMVIKTTDEHVEALKARLKALSSYDLPELLVLSVDGGSAEYLNWITHNVDAAGPGASKRPPRGRRRSVSKRSR